MAVSSHRRLLVVLLVVVLTGIGVTAATSQGYEQASSATDQRATASLLAGARGSIEAQVAALDDASTAVGLAWPLTAAEFDVWFSATRVDDRYPAIRPDVQIWEWVPPGDAEAVEDRELALGRPWFELSPSDQGRLVRVHRTMSTGDLGVGADVTESATDASNIDWSRSDGATLAPLSRAEGLFDGPEGSSHESQVSGQTPLAAALDAPVAADHDVEPLLATVPIIDSDGALVAWLAAVVEPNELVGSPPPDAAWLDLDVRYRSAAGTDVVQDASGGEALDQSVFATSGIAWTLTAIQPETGAPVQALIIVTGLLLTLGVAVTVAVRAVVLLRVRGEVALLSTDTVRARTCPLTGLGTRVVVYEHLKDLDSQADASRRSAVFYLDLDAFTKINDAVGHVAGDAVLVQVAARLSAVSRHWGTVCRVGGDEFAIIADHIERPSDLAAMFADIERAFLLPIHAGGQPWAIETSLGVAIQHTHSVRASDLLHIADRLMVDRKSVRRARRRAKASGALPTDSAPASATASGTAQPVVPAALAGAAARSHHGDEPEDAELVEAELVDAELVDEEIIDAVEIPPADGGFIDATFVDVELVGEPLEDEVLDVVPAALAMVDETLSAPPAADDESDDRDEPEYRHEPEERIDPVERDPESPVVVPPPLAPALIREEPVKAALLGRLMEETAAPDSLLGRIMGPASDDADDVGMDDGVVQSEGRGVRRNPGPVALSREVSRQTSNDERSAAYDWNDPLPAAVDQHI